MTTPFAKMDREYAQDVAYLESIGNRVPTDEEWEECKRIWDRTWDRLFQLTFIEGGARSRNWSGMHFALLKISGFYADK